MTPEQLRAAGRALHGDDFEDGLAYALHLAPGTLQRMLDGREPVDEPLRRELDRLLAAAGRRRIGPPILTHLVVNTGILLPSPKGQASPETVRALGPMAAAGRGEPAGIPFVGTHRGAGGGSFEPRRPAGAPRAPVRGPPPGGGGGPVWGRAGGGGAGAGGGGGGGVGRGGGGGGGGGSPPRPRGERPPARRRCRGWRCSRCRPSTPCRSTRSCGSPTSSAAWLGR